MATILMPLPRIDFDPSEASIPWKILTAKHRIVFATPDGQPAQHDARMIEGQGLGIWKKLLVATPEVGVYLQQMQACAEYQKPLTYEQAQQSSFDALLLVGGHAPGMKEYLESTVLQRLVASHDAARKPWGAVCHGVVLAARAKNAEGRSVLYGKKTTALLKSQELAAYTLTRRSLGNYYRTYPTAVEDEVRAALAQPSDFLHGPLPLRRDTLQNQSAGFVVKDGHYVSARWPGDAHRFALAFQELLS